MQRVSPRNSNKPVFDASAVLALLLDEPGTEKLIKVKDEAVISSVNVAEVLAKLISRGMPERDARAAFDALHLEVLGFEAHLAAESARYTAKDVSVGDRCFLATAQQYGLGWTSDRELPALLPIKLPFLRFFR